MTEDTVVDIAVQMLYLIIKCSAPMLVVSLIVGLAISIFQTVTSIQEQTLTFVPKLLAIVLVIIMAGPWIMNCIVVFFEQLCVNFATYIK